MKKYFILFLILFLQIRIVTAQAEDLLFDSDQWNKVDLHIEQSSHSVRLEAVLGSNENFERLLGYHTESRMRRLSRSVGLLRTRFRGGKFATCTGTLINEDRLLTNYHCVPGTGTHGPVVEAKLQMGYYDEVRDEGVFWYTVGLVPEEKNKDLDYSILEVQGKPGERWGWASFSENDPREGDSLLVIHHPGGAAKHITRGSCRAGPIDFPVLHHKCDTLPGSSGAPVFSDDETIVGLHYAGDLVPGPGAYNYATLISSLLSDVSSLKIQAGSQSEATVAAEGEESIRVKLLGSDEEQQSLQDYLNDPRIGPMQRKIRHLSRSDAWENSLHFDRNSVEINDIYHSMLEGYIANGRSSQTRIYIVGMRSREENISVARRRAESVRSYLIENGLSSDEIEDLLIPEEEPFTDESLSGSGDGYQQARIYLIRN